MSLEPVFDSPQWTFQVPPKGTEDYTAVIPVYIGVSGKSPVKAKKLVLPTEFFKFAKDVMKLEDFDNVELSLEKDGDRYYLMVSTSTQDLDLWYYTKSNLPGWAEV